MSTARDVQAALRHVASSEKAVSAQTFFKTGPGQYGEDDIFIGITVPLQRTVAKSFQELSLDQLDILLGSEIHEDRLTALIILVSQFQRATPDQQQPLVDFYLDHRARINNWDLVDLSAHEILGAYIYQNDRDILYRLAASDNLWDRRIAIVATYYLIRRDQFDDTLKLADILVSDKQDLMHKAVGWMLREVGKRDEGILVGYLKAHHPTMPRTTLRYAIERFAPETRRAYLRGEF